MNVRKLLAAKVNAESNSILSNGEYLGYISKNSSVYRELAKITKINLSTKELKLVPSKKGMNLFTKRIDYSFNEILNATLNVSIDEWDYIGWIKKDSNFERLSKKALIPSHGEERKLVLRVDNKGANVWKREAV